MPHPFVLLLGIAMFGATFAISASAAAEPTSQRAAQLTYIVRQDCGSCYGMKFVIPGLTRNPDV